MLIKGYMIGITKKRLDEIVSYYYFRRLFDH